MSSRTLLTLGALVACVAIAAEAGGAGAAVDSGRATTPIWVSRSVRDAGPAQRADGSLRVTLLEPPSVPFNVQARAKGNLGADVLWAAPTTDHGLPITSFTIAASPGGASWTVPGDAERAHVDGLHAGVVTAFTVVATNSAGNSKVSTAADGVVPAHVPVAPSQVTTKARDDATVELSWLPGVPGWDPVAEQAPATGYEITATPVNGVGTGDGPRVFTTAPSDATSAVVEGLRRGVEYAVTVRAINRVGDSEESAPSQVRVPSTIPGQVVGVGVMVVGSSSHDRSIVSFWWHVPNDGGAAITSYAVTVKAKGKWTGKDVSKTVSGAKHQTKLVLGPGRYAFKVAAVNADGKGRPSMRMLLRVR